MPVAAAALIEILMQVVTTWAKDYLNEANTPTPL